MFHKYFKITKKRVIFFCMLMLIILGVQFFLTGSLVSLQKVTTEAGTSNSTVLGILDDTEVVRQKFVFDRKVVLNSFTISFGSFKEEDVGTTLHIQMMDGNNDIVYETAVPVSDIKPNADYTVSMDRTVTIPKGVTCCIRLTCSSENSEYETIPTVNTTNRTAPNTYMSTIKMQTRGQSINISYTYTYRQVYPLVVFLVEILLLFVVIFERVTEYSVVFKKKHQKEKRRRKKAQIYEKEKMAQRRAEGKENATETAKSHKRQKGQTGKRGAAYSHSLRETVKRCLADVKIVRAICLAIAVINPILLAVMLEMMNGTFSTILPNVWIYTWILLGGIQLLFLAVIGNNGIAMLVMDLILFPVGLVNLFLMNVRGTPFLPSDILGVATATEVASTYTFSLTPAQFVVIPAFAFWCILLFRTREKGERRKKLYADKKHQMVWAGMSGKIKRRLLKSFCAVIPGLAIVMILYHTDVLASHGIKDNVWNKVSSCRSNGFYMNYFLNFHYLRVSAPADYSKEKVADILEEMKQENQTASVAASSSALAAGTGDSSRGNHDFGTNETLQGKKPNIILIMNESLADFSLVGDMNYNEDPFPFIHSLTKNTIKGKDYVSVFGAGTSNSEFEAMTGNTMTYFPSGCNVYQQFMHNSTFSLPSYLKELGYVCNAVHPSSGANWNRIATYKSMKFDRFVTIEDFKNPEYVRYISDKESYKKIIELYEKKGDQPMFAFDMTIQNHGGYLTNTSWKNPIYVEDSYYTAAKEFLSATRVSDDAFKYLVDYFSKEKEPTIICMFGDHFPSIETEFYEELLGKPQSQWELEDIQKRYASPFVLWANYDMEEAENVELSNNYLGNLMLKQAGLELPLYNQFIEKVSEEIPVMNVNGYKDKGGKWHSYGREETDEIKKLLEDYEILQYGYYSDMDKEEMGRLFQMTP